MLIRESRMRKEGTNLQDATVKAVAHVGIGIVGGEIGAKIGAGIGSLLAPGVGWSYVKI